MKIIKIIALRVCVAVVVAIVLPLPYAFLRPLGISSDVFVMVIAPLGVTVIWFVLAWIEPRTYGRVK